MPGPMHVTIRGVDPIIRRITDPAVIGDPIRDYYKEGTKEVQRNIKQIAPVRTGNYKRGIRRAGVSRKKIPKVAKVYSRDFVARFLEFGTKHITGREIFLRGLVMSSFALKALTTKFERDVIKKLNGRVGP